MRITAEHFKSRKAAVKLLALAQGKSPPALREIYEDVWDLALSGALAAGTLERVIAFDILRKLESSVERDIRAALAQELAKNPAAPKDLVLMLADSSIEMAAPVLQYSPILQDDDLVNLIGRVLVDHQLAIAARGNIGESVCDALAAKGDRKVVERLLNNHTAHLSEKLMRSLVEESKTVESYRRPLILRPDLPVALAEEMYAWVGDTLRALIVCQFDIDPAVLDQSLSKAVKSGVDRLQAGVNALDPEAMLVEKLFSAGQLGMGYLVGVLRDGQIKLFEHALKQLSGLPVTSIREAVRDTKGETLATICAALSIDRMVYSSIVQMTRQLRGDLGLREKADTLLKHYDAIDRAEAKATLDRWQQNPQAISSQWH